MDSFILVCLGGAAGSGARYLVAEGMARLLGRGFPWGTLAVNVIGSFAIELVLVAATVRVLSPAGTLLLASGFMGGFTTYSAFNSQILGLARAGSYGPAAGYLALTVVACVLSGLGGGWLAAHWFGKTS